MRMRERVGQRRRGAAALVLAMVLAACSGGGDESPGDAEPGAPTDPTAVPTAVPTEEVVPEPTSTTSTTASATTVPASTTTTLPPPAILPLGQVWTSTTIETGTTAAPAELVTVGDELWAVGSRWNGPAAWRTSDGAGWSEVPVAGPPDSGALGLAGIVARPDGGYLAWGHAGSSCQADLDRGNGYRETGLCRRQRPVVFLSDDGAAWRRVDPPAMQPGGGATILVDDLTAVPDGFVAVGTHRSPDWYGIIWFSADGENWERVTELRGADGPMSGHEVLWDGTTLVLLAHEHPCSQNDINDNTPGWILGAQWAEHLRMFVGPNVRELTPVAPDDHPILQPRLAVDCSVDDAFFLAMEPYADARGEVINGVITLVDETPPPVPDESETDDADGEDAEEPIHPRRLVTLTDGAWSETIVDGFDRGSDQLVEIDGGPALLRIGQAGEGRSSTEILRPGSDGTWAATAGDRPIIGSLVRLAAGFGDSVLALARAHPDPFATSRTSGDPVEVLVWSTRDVREDEVVRCLPVAGAVCRLADFTSLDGYPDLAGADFAGADLMFADLGAGDYSGASFAGSTLSGASVDTSDGTPTFVGADFTGANLRGAELEDVAGADLSGADLSNAAIKFSGPPASLSGAILTATRLEVVRDATREYRSFEISLAGFDLTRTRIRGPLGDGEVRLRVTDLRGAVLDGTSFYAVDLTGVQLDEGTDLADVEVWDNSLCPDGLPPTDGPIGTCARP